MMNGKMKRLLAGLMCLVMVVGLLPVTAGAAELANGYYYIGDDKHFVAADGSASTESYACYVKAIDGGYSIACDSGYLAAITADTTEIAYVDTSDTAFAWQWDGEHFYMTPDTYEASASYICYSSVVTGGLGLTTDRSAAFTATVVSDSAEDETTVDEITNVPAVIDNSSTEFIRAFALDCGRIYFSVEDIKEIIDVMAANDYTHLTLAFGNSGFRFLLDDMKIGDYSSDAVKNAILDGNTNYATNDGHNGSSAANTCLTEAQMDTIISYANSKGIAIIPALNSPGHMNTIVYAMGQLGISDAGYPVTSSYNSESTININNSTVTDFTNALIQKYINYFKAKGCTMFNLGADEFANDPTDDEQLGFTAAVKDGFISYVNGVATQISNAGMIPMMFNDGYAWSDANFNKDIVVCYWTSGAVSSTAIANAGHNVINNSRSFYYVLGEPFGTDASSWCSYASATNGVKYVPVTQMVDGGSPDNMLVGAQMWLWCDYTDEAYTAEEEAKVHTLISTLAENNPTYFSIPEEPETREVTVMVNQTVTDNISGHVYTEAQIADPSVVSVELSQIAGVEETTVSTTKATELEDGATYILRVYNTNYALSSATGRSDWDTDTLAFQQNDLTANTNHMWTLEKVDGGYKLKNASGYLNLGTGNNTAYLNDTGEVFTITNTDTGWTIGNQSGRYINALGGLYSYYTAGGWTGDGTRFDLYKVTTATGASTGVDFTGLTVGTTTATVGHVTYTINVIAEDLSAVTLTYHPWLSNYSVHEEGTGASNCNGNLGVANPQTIAATSTDVNSESGAVFADLVWATGDWRWEEGAQTVFWKGTVLDEEHRQEGNSADDMCMDGADFTYIRYWGGQWSYSSDQESWTAILDTDEVCAYYLQETGVTAEVETFVKDWAFTTENSNQGNGRYQKALSFAVVYPGGTMNPSEADIYANSTLIYWDNLADLGFLRIGVNEVYEIEKITYTFGQRVSSSESAAWTTDDSINWNKKTINEKTWYDETVCWDESYGTEPVVNGAALNDVIYAGTSTISNNNEETGFDGPWGADDAVLILIYLKPVATEDSLTVIYYDEKFGDTLHDYSIIVNSEVNFNNGIGEVTTDDDGNVTINTNVKPGIFKAGTDEENKNRIDVTGFGIMNRVSDTVSVAQRFQTDLTQVPDAFGKYNNELYKYTGSEISEDGKTLYLYYNINESTLSPNFVVDFGLPISFPLTALLGEGTESENVEAVSGLSARYGVLTYDETSESFNYRPTSVINTIDVLSISLTIDGMTATSNVGVTPASNVLYEEGFMTVQPGSGADWLGGSNSINNVDSDKNVDTDTDGKQSNANAAPYGYDEEYNGSTGASGTQYVATLASSGASKFADYMTFTFTGTGFDLIGACGPETGTLMVRVDKNGSYFKSYLVDTSFSDDLNGDGVYDTLYQVPILHADFYDTTADDLGYAEYTVTVSGAYINYNYGSVAPASFGLYDDISMGFAPTVYENPIEIIYELFYSMGLNERQIDDVEFINMDALYGVSTMAYDADPKTEGYQAPTSMTLEIDGFRIYRTTQNASYKDASSGNEYDAIYSNVTDADSGSVFAYVEPHVVTYEDGEKITFKTDVYDIGVYEGLGGPQDEIYIPAGYGVVFKLDSTTITKAHVSARVVTVPKVKTDDNGNVVNDADGNNVYEYVGTTMVAGTNTATEIAITSHTEMYYEVDVDSEGCITIVNNGPEMLAIGNIKALTGLSTVSPQYAVQATSLMMMRYSSSGSDDSEEDNDATQDSKVEDTETEDSVDVPTIIWPTYTPSQNNVFRPEEFEMEVGSYTLFGQRFVTIKVNASTDVAKLTINGTPLWAANYIWVKQGLADEYVYTMLLIVPENKAAFFEVLAYNEDGIASKVYTITD